MRKATTDWRASDVEIVDGTYVRPQVDAERDHIIETIAWLMDRSIPIGGFRIGLDPIIGLIPGFGDVVSTLISAVLIVQAHRAGVPKATVLRMMTNVGIDTAAGIDSFCRRCLRFRLEVERQEPRALPVSNAGPA